MSDESYLPTEYTTLALERFRAHALALRADGATHVSIGAMSVQFEPHERELPATFVAALKEAGDKKAAEATPASDEDYVP